MSYYKASDEELTNELTVTIKEMTRLRQLVDDSGAKLFDLRKPFGAGYGVAQSNVEYSCVSLGSFLKDIDENFRTGRDKSGNEVFCAGSIGS